MNVRLAAPRLLMRTLTNDLTLMSVLSGISTCVQSTQGGLDGNSAAPHSEWEQATACVARVHVCRPVPPQCPQHRKTPMGQTGELH